MNQHEQCQHIKKDGERCQARPLKGSTFCFFHDPAVAQKRAEARKTGGRNSRAAALPPELAEMPLETPEDVVKMLGETVNLVRRGELDPKVGNTVGGFSRIMLTIMDASAGCPDGAEVPEEIGPAPITTENVIRSLQEQQNAAH